MLGIPTAPTIDVIRFHPIRENEVWVGGMWFDGVELWHSVDLGENWTDRHEILDTLLVKQYGEDIFFPQSLHEIAFDPAEANAIYLGSEWLWNSKNCATTWTVLLDTLGAYRTVSVNPSNSKEIYISAGRHFFKTIDKGDNWESILLPMSKSVMAFIEVDWQNRILYTHFFSQELSREVLGVYKRLFDGGSG